MDVEAVKAEILKVARERLDAVYKEFPSGCEDSQMKAFLEAGKYPKIAYAMAMGWEAEVKRLLALEVSRYGK